jgi:aspartyl/asparaginyl beta-hydroxylase (cupin superfamily)
VKYPVLKKVRAVFEWMIHFVQPSPVLNKEDYSWYKEVEKYHPQIKIELEKLLLNLDNVTNFNSVLPNQRALKQDDQWKSYFIKVLGENVEKHVQECPVTFEAIEKIPGVINAFFSILRPGVHIPAHRGPYAGILRYHLGVKIPKGDVGIRVGSENCQWEEGKSLFFDDSFDHEAWNKTDEIRAILFVDIKRPLPIGLDQLNRGLLSLFAQSKAANYGKNIVLNT